MQTSIGGWRLLRRISSGGCGAVWKAARDSGVGASFLGALKLPLAHTVTSRRETVRFLDEVRATMTLDHPNIVRVMDAGVDGHVPYMVMQWVHGIDLKDLRAVAYANGRVISVPVALHVVSKILAALAHSHGRAIGGRDLGILHRDIKPANVLISLEGHVLLTDYGVARFLDNDKSGNTHGTTRYMAPEQFRGKATQQSDLWGVGAVLWELLAGQPFLFECTTEQIVERLIEERHVPNPPFRPDYDPELLQVLAKLLAVDVDLRYKTAQEALDAVESCSQFTANPSELRDLVRKFRQAEKSGYTELLSTDLLTQDAGSEIDTIFALAGAQQDDEEPTRMRPLTDVLRHRSPTIPPSAPDILREEDAPTLFRRPHRDKTVAQASALLPIAAPTEKLVRERYREAPSATEALSFMFKPVFSTPVPHPTSPQTLEIVETPPSWKMIIVILAASAALAATAVFLLL